ncbi:MAG TPA: type II toxin-antitoxin system HicA family toxin [Patescibacteria group bacterium]|nr:type II toxin-antitoxin system HicA family toxin [Patescibacteria group bacterium]
MPKSISWRKLVQVLRQFGFDGPYSGGRHLFMIKESLKLHIPNPHPGEVSKHLLSQILRQAEISSQEWNNKLNN